MRSRSPSAPARLAFGPLALVVLVVTGGAPAPALALLSSVSGSTSGSTCNAGSNSDHFCGFARSFTVPSNGTTFTSRYAWNINADVGIFSTSDQGGNAQHNVSFTASAPGSYRLDISTTRRGDMNRVSDASGCDGAANTSGVTGVSNIALNSGSLSLADPGSIGNGGGDSSVPFNQSSGTAQILRTSNGVGQNHTLTFTWNGSVRSNSCEAAVRQGQANGSTTGCDGCEYPGSPGRTESTDGHFVTVTFTSLCGNGVVDGGVGEQCDVGAGNGQPGTCCTSSCQIAANGASCRPAASVCDVAESCDGSSTACPADAVAPAGGVCRSVAGVCDVAESCDGSNPVCPADGFVANGTECNPSLGVCDPAESCTGSAAACPADVLSPAGTNCRSASGLCDEAEECTGSSAACPADGVQPGGTTCRASAGICDVAELCDGSSKSCPANGFVAAGVECRAQANACDFAESCTGSAASCPADTASPDSDGDGFCDAVDNCDDVNTGNQVDDDSDGLGNACDPCTNVLGIFATKQRIIVQKLNTPPGDDRLTFRGQAILPPTPAVDPVANGARVVIENQAGIVLLDAILPGGAYDNGTKLGWKVNKKGDAWTYFNRSPSTIAGVTGVSLRQSATTPGLFKWTVRAKDASLPVALGDVPLAATFVVDAPTAETGQCAEAGFAVGGCAFNPPASTVTCK